MSYFENLWEEFRSLQIRERGISGEHVDQMRNAFFTGAWCHMAFARRIRRLQGEVANEVMRDVEEELFSAVAQPQPARVVFQTEETQRLTENAL